MMGATDTDEIRQAKNAVRVFSRAAMKLIDKADNPLEVASQMLALIDTYREKIDSRCQKLDPEYGSLLGKNQLFIRVTTSLLPIVVDSCTSQIKAIEAFNYSKLSRPQVALQFLAYYKLIGMRKRAANKMAKFRLETVPEISPPQAFDKMTLAVATEAAQQSLSAT